MNRSWIRSSKKPVLALTGPWVNRFGGQLDEPFRLTLRVERKPPDAGPRRILADFLIGAHALEGGHTLLTLDDHLYRKAFPRLAVVRV